MHLFGVGSVSALVIELDGRGAEVGFLVGWGFVDLDGLWLDLWLDGCHDWRVVNDSGFDDLTSGGNWGSGDVMAGGEWGSLNDWSSDDVTSSDRVSSSDNMARSDLRSSIGGSGGSGLSLDHRSNGPDGLSWGGGSDGLGWGSGSDNLWWKLLDVRH